MQEKLKMFFIVRRFGASYRFEIIYENRTRLRGIKEDGWGR